MQQLQYRYRNTSCMHMQANTNRQGYYLCQVTGVEMAVLLQRLVQK
jgi:hypothetical protein